ncbi:hypothetical protein [Actinomadura livida]|uniref:SMI1/KNR4 family protein n=1 Tax=Actinomadura livida TaxID=79909 RepID=A0A7W7II65_9ACTN|nr:MULTISPECIES: hypothetical protein [Actinomadura]MBB4777479.1 hypothetical protein [Actinomadura catellatispora]GGU31211.1 hypothetical protein GCM10010208_64910 [Actinomadura livida]
MTIPALLEERFGAPLAEPPVVDWQMVRHRLGTDLPNDYRDLADRYPLLMIDEWLPVLHPATPDPPRNDYGLVDLLRYATTQSRFVRDFKPSRLHTYTPGRPDGAEEVVPTADRVPFPIYPDAGGLMAWGMPENGSICCWLTEGHPDDWTIVVASEPDCWHYRGSITEFLVAVLIRRVRCPAFPADFPLGEDWQVEQIFD